MTNYSLRWYLACNPKAFAIVQVDFLTSKEPARWYTRYNQPPMISFVNNDKQPNQ